jgi:hypothetical protein
MSKSIYEQHDAAFSAVSAYVIAKNGQVVARISIKRGSAVTAYVHWLGLEMQRATAGGGGYDRTSAAIISAAEKIRLSIPADSPTQFLREAEAAQGFKDALSHDDGNHWDWHLREAGFDVWQAV